MHGEKQFVLFQYDESGGVGTPRYRVALAERCGVGPWSIEPIRTPDVFLDDQTTMVGHPSIAINRLEQVIHVVFAEMTDYTGGFPGAGTLDHQLFWARRGYDTCP